MPSFTDPTVCNASFTVIQDPKHFCILDHKTKPSFKYGHDMFRPDLHAQTYFEKVFGIELLALYTTRDMLHPNGDKLNWSTRTLILFFKDGRVVELQNSEWATVNLLVTLAEK